jgi:hypothetical protein
MKKIKINTSKLFSVLAVLVLIAFTIAPFLADHQISAYALPSDRTIIMSNTAISGTGVSYQVSFIPSTSGETIGGLVVDFCSDSPIIGYATCAAPTGMTLAGSVTTSTGFSSAPAWTATYNNTGRSSLTLSSASTYTTQANTTISTALSSSSSGTSQSITVASATGYPIAATASPATYFYVTIPSTGEILQVTNTSGTTWQVTRGSNGSVATSAGSGLAITAPPISFTMSNVTNTSAIGAFYARIITFSTGAVATSYGGSNSYSSTIPGTAVDAGGVALYTTNSITISAKVQEYLQFCLYVSMTATSSACSYAGASYAVTLGNTYGILSSTTAYDDSSTRWDIATNASQNAVVAFTGSPLQIGSTGHYLESSSLSGTGAVAATAYSSSVGAAQFGLCVNAAVSGDQSTGYSSANMIWPTTDEYYNATCPNTLAQNNTSPTGTFAFNIAQAATTYGDILGVQKPGVGSTAIITFLGNIAPITIPGSYATNLNFVATGSY